MHMKSKYTAFQTRSSYDSAHFSVNNWGRKTMYKISKNATRITSSQTKSDVELNNQEDIYLQELKDVASFCTGLLSAILWNVAIYCRCPHFAIKQLKKFSQRINLKSHWLSQWSLSVVFHRWSAVWNTTKNALKVRLKLVVTPSCINHAIKKSFQFIDLLVTIRQLQLQPRDTLFQILWIRTCKREESESFSLISPRCGSQMH